MFFIFPIHSVSMSVTTWINYLSQCSLSPSTSRLIAADAQCFPVHVVRDLGATLMGGSGMRLILASVKYLMSNWGWGSLFQKVSWGQEIAISCRRLKGDLCLPCGFLHRLFTWTDSMEAGMIKSNVSRGEKLQCLWQLNLRSYNYIFSHSLDFSC